MWKTVREALLGLVTLWYLGLALVAVVVFIAVLSGLVAPAAPTPHGQPEPYTYQR